MTKVNNNDIVICETGEAVSKQILTDYKLPRCRCCKGRVVFLKYSYSDGREKYIVVCLRCRRATHLEAEMHIARQAWEYLQSLIPSRNVDNGLSL